MRQDKTLLVATAGQAVLRSHDDGATWGRIKPDQELEFDDSVRCILPDPQKPQAVFAGADTGLFRSEDCGVNWHRVDCALNPYAVWKLVVDQRNPDIMYAGTGSPSRAAFFRSGDAGKRWEKCRWKCRRSARASAGRACLRWRWIPMMPARSGSGWRRAVFSAHRMAGKWRRIDANVPKGVRNSDLHAIVILPGPAKTIAALTVNALYTSIDSGETWNELVIRERWDIYYSRVLVRKPGSDSELFMSISDGTPGTTSMFLRSKDRGKTWLNAPLPVQPNSCIWAIGTNAVDPNVVLAGAEYGHLFRSRDGGLSWRKDWREFSEITDVTWIPAVPAVAETGSHGHS